MFLATGMVALTRHKGGFGNSAEELGLTFTSMKQTTVGLVVIAMITLVPAYGQKAKWAEPANETAKYMINMERQWAEAACDHNNSPAKILADDFQGTSPDGRRYTKSEEVADTHDSSHTVRDCRLLDAKVRFFGTDLATVYGSETSLRKLENGIDKSRCLIWTDTWLKRNGIWQIIAAQDTQFDCK